MKNTKDTVVKNYFDDAKKLLALRTSKKFNELVIPEYPLDLQLLNLSPLYRHSRELFLELGGTYSPRLCSTMRGLSTQDLFKNHIDYPPSLSELTWFVKEGHKYSDAKEQVTALIRFSEISIFHEQNHRIIWPLLPKIPKSEIEVCKYLNFAEALVVTLDMAMADQLGPDISQTFERMKLIYHPGAEDQYSKKPTKDYRDYLLAIFTTVYFMLETMHLDDILKAVDYVLPGKKKINRVAVDRGLQLSELFAHVTNPEWQKINWKSSQQKLKKLQADRPEQYLVLPKDPLDLDSEFDIVRGVFDHFGI